MTIQWRQHQREALDAIAAAGGLHSWVVMPPGAGKTLVGAEAARQTGRRVVAFGPNVAITQQWCEAWAQLTGGKATRDRDLPTDFTALTYQSLAVFDADADGDTARSRLHPNGEALIERLHAAGPLTIILDECHHLLQVWGSLLAEVLAELDDAVVIALTATPPELLSPVEMLLVSQLFGSITYQVGIPEVVAAGDLVPFAELAWFTSPTKREQEWLDARARRGLELITELTRVDVSTPLITWAGFLDLAAIDEAQADAVIRLARAEKLPMPDDAHVVERHRRPPDLEDWLTLASPWLLQLRDSDERRDRAFAERIADLLPGVGFRLTRHGIRPGQAMVDRVLSRSASKADATVELLRAASPDSKLLVLTDFATAGTLPADLDGVVEPESGSAEWILRALLRDVPEVEPVMVTGSAIAGSERAMRVLDPERACPFEDGIWTIEGGDSSHWVAAATAALADGTIRCVVGTRALLGEGWDAQCVTGVIDLTSSTTSTAIVQTRGRSLRVDPANPDKVAVNWTVTCLAPDRPQGDADYRRLVRKHSGWFSVDQEGEVTDGVAHLDAALSPDAVPEDPDAINRRSLERSRDVDAIREAWASVNPQRQHPLATVRIYARILPEEKPLEREQERFTWEALVVVWLPAIILGFMYPGGRGIIFTLAVIATVIWGLFERSMRVQALRRQPSVVSYGRAVAAALQERGLASVGADGVRADTTLDGEVRLRLEGVTEQESERFAVALAEVLDPVDNPRYLVSRSYYNGGWAPWPERNTEVWHRVPSIFADSREHADRFVDAWDRYVSPGRAVYIGTPEGQGLLRAVRWSSPLGEAAGLSATIRRSW